MAAGDAGDGGAAAFVPFDFAAGVGPAGLPAGVALPDALLGLANTEAVVSKAFLDVDRANTMARRAARASKQDQETTFSERAGMITEMKRATEVAANAMTGAAERAVRGMANGIELDDQFYLQLRGNIKSATINSLAPIAGMIVANAGRPEVLGAAGRMKRETKGMLPSDSVGAPTRRVGRNKRAPFVGGGVRKRPTAKRAGPKRVTAKRRARK